MLPDTAYAADLDAVHALAAKARRHTTPCGQGAVVWHVWGYAQAEVAPLVLLHGGSGSWTHWVRNVDALVTAGRELWVPDLPGFGASALPGTGTDADAMVEPLRAGLQALMGDQPVDLVGFSLGGLTAGLLLAAHPDLAQRLVLVGAPAMGVVPKRQFELKTWRHLSAPDAQLDVHRHNLAALMLHDPQQIEGLALHLHVANMRQDRMPGRRLSGTDILARSLPRIACPVHAIYGRYDAVYLGYLEQLAAVYSTVTPHFCGMTFIENAGHWVQFEQADRFNTALLAALAA